MSIGLLNYPNRDVTDLANYPEGNIKDNPGDGTGTPINVLTTADIHQTFYKLLDIAGITPNGDPDNVTNGYQYIEAIRKIPNEVFTPSGAFVGVFTVGFEYDSCILITSSIPSNPTFNLDHTDGVPGHKTKIHWIGDSGGSTVFITATSPSIVVGDVSIGVGSGVSGIAEFTYLGYDGTNHIYLSKAYS